MVFTKSKQQFLLKIKIKFNATLFPIKLNYLTESELAGCKKYRKKIPNFLNFFSTHVVRKLMKMSTTKKISTKSSTMLRGLSNVYPLKFLSTGIS